MQLRWDLEPEDYIVVSAWCEQGPGASMDLLGCAATLAASAVLVDHLGLQVEART